MEKGFLFGAAAWLALVSAQPALAESGVRQGRIVLGQSAALTGPSAALGQGMRDGILAAFAEANRTGGVKGHQLGLISVDDSYDPDKAIAAVRRLIDQDKVLALVGLVGTPTSVAVEPIAAEEDVPYIGAFTGAEFLRNPYKPNVVNVRASYFQETETMVDHLTKDLGVTRIAVFFQDDAFGRAGLAGVKRALASRGLQLAALGGYVRGTVAVDDALQTIKAGTPQAVIMIGTYKPSAAFIKLARAAGMNATFINISFVGADALGRELGPAGAGVVVTEVVPFPGDPSIGVVGRYQAAMRAFQPDQPPGFVSLEGYIVGRVVIAALGRIDGKVTRKALLDQVTSAGSLNLGGITLSYGPGNNRGSNDVFLTEIQADGTARPVARLQAPNK
jgi:ABC-type branched-subunit amino acid transport system substrate-binding protein